MKGRRVKGRVSREEGEGSNDIIIILKVKKVILKIMVSVIQFCSSVLYVIITLLYMSVIIPTLFFNHCQS